MIEEFHNVLRTPKNSEVCLGHIQNLVVQSLQEMFPQNFDLSQLHKIYEETLGAMIFPNTEDSTVTMQQQIALNYKLVQYFISAVRQNFIPVQIYKALQEQTQKAEQTIRSHIKIEQEMKMYLEYLENRIQKLQRNSHDISFEGLRRQICILSSRESLLQKQKINLIKRNQKLRGEVEILKSQIESLCSPKDSFIARSIMSRNLVEDIHKQQMRSSETNFLTKKQTVKISSRTSYDREKEKQKEKERQAYKIGHNYDLTQKKKSSYFPEIS